VNPTNDLAEVVARFPGHRELGAALQHGVNAAMVQHQTTRGEVHAPEDVFATVRWIQATAESLAAYAKAFAGAAKLCETYAEDELLAAVGESDGIPTRPLTVPDADGDIVLSVDQPNRYLIDLDTVLSAVAYSSLRVGYTLAEQEALAGLLIKAMKALLALGKFEPQVSKIRALAAQLARDGEDQISSVVTGSVTKTRAYKGVNITRKKPA
jgi:hypothetical protein